MAKGGVTTYDIYVTNLPPDANERVVRDVFFKFGGIQSLNVFDARNGPGRVAFVRFRTESCADDACNESLEVAGQKLGVRRAKRGGASGGMGGGGSRKPFVNRSPREAVAGPDIVPVSDVSDRRSQSSESEVSNFGEVVREEEVVVTHVENAICLWVQTITENNAQGLASLTSKLQQTCPAAPKVKGTPVNGKHYGTMFSQDDQWYRCLIRQFNSVKGKAKVLYVDFGNVEEKDVTELVEIPQSLANIQPFAQKIVFHSLFMKTESDGEPVSYESYVSGVQFLRELTEGQILTAHLTIPLRDSLGYYGDVLVNNNSVSEMVIQRGFATRRSMLPNKKTFRGQSSPAGGASPQRQNLSTSAATPDRAKPSPRIDASDLKMKLEKERAEKDMLTLELASLKGKLKHIQAEHTALARKTSEDYIGHQIQEIVSLAEKVRSLRSQFPSDCSSSDCLSQSLSTASAEDRVSLDSISSLRRVNEALDAYTGMQNAIRACQTMAELEGLTDQRDRRRQELHTSLQVFLDEAAAMPLDQRMEKVQAVLANLALSYNGFLHFIVNKQPGLEDAKSMYDEWKQKVLSGFEEVRCQSNRLQDSISSTLGELQKLIVLDGQVAVTTSTFDLDGLFKKYIAALQKEVDVTDVQHSNEACFMASIVSEVKRVFEEELKIIQSVRCLSVEFDRQKVSIEEWLHKKPDLQDIRNVRKTLRGLKSKLRHLLADKEDIDENEDGSEDERARITQELCDLRRELHETVLKEEGLQMKYSVLQEEHFPELRLTHADLNLDLYQTYKGLLKTSREIDQYDLIPYPVLPGCRQVMFCDKPAIIKEYVVDDQIHASKDEFLRRALAYSQVISPSLVPIQAAFLAKSQKQVYVQTPVSGVPLCQFLSREDIRPWVIQKILRSVTEGVIALHKAGIVHGDISPQSVLVTETKTAQLTLPDFSRPVVDPSRTWFISDSGLEFRAPEEDHTQAPTMASDLFCLGLLYVWIHLPNSSLERNVNGVPVLQNLSISETVRYAAQAFLCSQPSSRVAASEILQTGYFQDILPDLLHVDTVAESPPAEPQGDGSVEDQETEGGLNKSNSLLDSPTDDLPEAVLCPRPLLSTTSMCGVTDGALVDGVGSVEPVCEDKPVEITQITEENVAMEPSLAADVFVNGGQDQPKSDVTDLIDSTDTPSVLPMPSDTSQDGNTYNREDDVPYSWSNPEASPSTMDGEFLVDKRTMASLVSMSACLPPPDGSGDSMLPQINSDLDGPEDSPGGSENPVDNATLIQNLLQFTTQHTNNLGF